MYDKKGNALPRGYRIAWLLLFASISLPLFAQEDLEEILQGFDETPPATDEPEAVEEDVTDNATDDVSGNSTGKPSRPWSVKGFTQTSLSYNYAHHAPDRGKTDYRGLSQLKQGLQLEWEMRISNDWKILIGGNAFYDFSYISNGRDNYTDAVLEQHESEAEIREAYIQGSIRPDLDVKLGRQIVVWGTSDTLRVVDILNPLDNREPGMTDLEDLRLPVSMTRLDYYPGNWNLTGIIVHEVRFNKNPAYGSDYYPFPVPLPAEITPNGPELAMSLGGHLTGWDISLHTAWYYNDQPHIRRGRLEHSRLTMAGAATNVALGSWLLKGEIAWIQGLKFANLANDKLSRLDTMLGLEYSGFDETMIALEFVNRHLYGFNSFNAALARATDVVDKDEQQIVLRYQQDFKHATWHLSALLSAFGLGTHGGAFARIELKHDIVDALSITAGLIAYQQGDNPVFGRFDDNDRVFTKLRYSF